VLQQPHLVAERLPDAGSLAFEETRPLRVVVGELDSAVVAQRRSTNDH
jgi:hypothetical protein